VIARYADVFFLPLLTRLVNDDSPACRSQARGASFPCPAAPLRA
jgi:hypothetical protein